MPDEEAWDLYYKGEGDFPEDPLGIVLTGLKRASENPEIENVIFDLSCNGGGSPDVMMAILEVATGQTQLYGIHRLTDRDMTFIPVHYPGSRRGADRRAQQRRILLCPGRNRRGGLQLYDVQRPVAAYGRRWR